MDQHHLKIEMYKVGTMHYSPLIFQGLTVVGLISNYMYVHLLKTRHLSIFNLMQLLQKDLGAEKKMCTWKRVILQDYKIFLPLDIAKDLDINQRSWTIWVCMQ